jgi:hypothetical protein
MKNVRQINFPGWTADCTLLISARTYVANPNKAAVRGGALTPALSVCRNLRPGWAIENTLCAECAELLRVCNLGFCHWQLGEWHSECWSTNEAIQ